MLQLLQVLSVCDNNIKRTGRIIPTCSLTTIMSFAGCNNNRNKPDIRHKVYSLIKPDVLANSLHINLQIFQTNFSIK